MKKLDFFIVGAQKCATTALYRKLTTHPKFFATSNKEIHFFDNENLDWAAPPYDILHQAYRGAATDLVWGEATPIYMYWPNSIERIAAYNPDAKIIICLRHPAHRALSQWRMETSRNRENIPFSAAISSVGRNRFNKDGQSFHRVFSYVERGYYAWQIERVLRHFPRENIHFETSDNLYYQENEVFNRLFNLFSVDNLHNIGGEKIIRLLVAPPKTGNYDQEIHDLTKAYADDIRATSRLTGLDLDHWLLPDYAEPF